VFKFSEITEQAKQQMFTNWISAIQPALLPGSTRMKT
jgi:hypothetical protein